MPKYVTFFHFAPRFLRGNHGATKQTGHLKKNKSSKAHKL